MLFFDTLSSQDCSPTGQFDCRDQLEVKDQVLYWIFALVG